MTEDELLRRRADIYVKYGLGWFGVQKDEDGLWKGYLDDCWIPAACFREIADLLDEANK